MVISESEIQQPDILQRLLEIHQALGRVVDGHGLARAVNFMIYELTMILQPLSGEAVLPALNHFFFEQKHFRLGSGFSLNEVVVSREGCSILVALMYLHLAGSCGMKMNLVHWPMHTVLRWETSPGKYSDIDLERRGEVLSAEEILALVCKHKKELSPLGMREAVQQYLSYLSVHFRGFGELDQLHTVLGLILDVEPENTRYIAERAILRRDLGLVKEALQDLKRYFAFTNADSTAPEIVTVYNELRAMAPALS
jgi:regulator of sirC expression with transglutaminase-like and TPR domain